MHESRPKNSQRREPELNDGGDIIRDHPFIPAKDNPLLCGFVRGSNNNGTRSPVCRLAEAAHAKAVVSYKPTSVRAKPGEAR